MGEGFSSGIDYRGRCLRTAAQWDSLLVLGELELLTEVDVADEKECDSCGSE